MIMIAYKHRELPCFTARSVADVPVDEGQVEPAVEEATQVLQDLQPFKHLPDIF